MRLPPSENGGAKSSESEVAEKPQPPASTAVGTPGTRATTGVVAEMADE